MDYKEAVKKPIDLGEARALADQIVAEDQGRGAPSLGPSWFGALARCVVTLCDEVERLRKDETK
jgi:hypothetical protein